MSKKYSYDEALNDSLNYFNGDDLAAKVFLDKYALRDNDGNILENEPSLMHRRIAKEFARIEKGKFKNPLSESQIFDLLDGFKYIIPQGSPMFGIGNDYQIISLSNCFLLDLPLDSYSSILQVDEQLVNISKRRGGVGIDLSNLRPAGTSTKNAAKTSTGIVTWMERYSNSIREVGQSGRRGALMLTLDIHHPDIVNFCTIKKDRTKVTGANISVRLSKEFLNAVKSDSEYELRFPVNYKQLGIAPLISKKVSAKEIWDLIIDSAHQDAEPGLLMWDNVTELTPADCYEDYKSKGTNPCSELNLSPLDSCRLLCLNLFSYVQNPFTKNAGFDYELFNKHSIIAQRLMDDLVDLESEKIDKIIQKINSDPEPLDIKEREIKLWNKIKKFNNEGRRTGSGITALGDCLAALNIKYGSKKSIDATQEIYKSLKLACFRSSVDMAKELGSFKGFDANLEKDNQYLLRIKEEDENLYNEMQKYGRRNIALTTTAPTGSVSICSQTTSGIEPLFMISYTRRKKINPADKNVRVDFKDQNGDNWQEFTVYHPKVKLWMEITGEKDIEKSPWHGCCADDIDWINRVKLQGAAQLHVCHSISSTINLPENVSKDTVSKIYQTAFEEGLKGITIYRKNCRTGVLVDSNSKKSSNEKISHTTAPKRPKELNCDVHHLSHLDNRYYVIIGLLESDPYECFIGLNNDGEGDAIVPKSIKSGILVKEGKGKYVLKTDDYSYLLKDTGTDENADVLARMLSTSLRHGSSIPFLVHQLEKTKGNLTSFSKVLCRVLKKYIKDGTVVSGESCPTCSNQIIRENGCKICKNCGWSACG